ncbi:hypothetical protein GCM10009839_44420 [Catenulispora yoronensis]|uniref:Uncharacterized protein n=1 Tax=Catenulispora yoronensis TaxID=450799 RepID=A0ABP5G5X5_9ACTN
MSNNRSDGGDTRSLDWTILGFGADPVPGDPAYLRVLAGEFQDRADRVEQIRREVQSMMTDESLMAWLGASGDAFRSAMDPFPKHLSDIHEGYSRGGEALVKFAGVMEGHKATASEAYREGDAAWREAKVDPTDGMPDFMPDPLSFQRAADELLRKHLSVQDQQWAGNGTGPVQGGTGSPEYFLSKIMAARAKAAQAGDDCDRASQRCESEIGDATGYVVLPGRQGNLTFDEIFSQHGGNPADLVLVQHGSADFIAAVDQVLADAGRKDAADLAKAVADPDNPASQAIIAKIGTDLENAQNDPAFLQAFFAAGGAASVSKVLMQLAPPDLDTLAMPKDRDAYNAKALINQYAIGVAAATRRSDLGEIHLPPDTWEPLWHGDGVRSTMIPAALLLSFGPTGDQYGHTFIADAGARVLRYDAGSTDSSRAFRDLSENTWGLAPDILRRVGENPAACRDLLDPTRTPSTQVDANYQSLLYKVSALPFSDHDKLAATIIHNATTDLTGHPDSSREATAALFHNLNGTNLTPGLAMSVSQAASAHLDSMMENATNKMVDGPTTNGIIPLRPEQMDNVLKSFAADQPAAANFNGAIGAQALNLSRQGDFDIHNGTSADMEALKQLGNLQGDLNLHQQQAGVDIAHQQDKNNAMTQAWIKTVVGEANAVGPLPFKVIHGAAPVMQPFYEDLLPTDAAQKAAATASFSLSAGASALDVPLVQGMIDRGQIAPPPNAPWFKNGMVDLSTPDARNQFNYWHDHQQGAGMDLVRTLSGTVTQGYTQSGQAWNIK